MSETEKSRIIKDIEFRVFDETRNINYIKTSFMELLEKRSEQERGVRFSELQYDESIAMIKRVMEEFQEFSIMQEFQNQVNRIYQYRLDHAQRDTLLESGQSTMVVNSEIFGNILERNTFCKDMLRPFYRKALPKHLRQNVWRALLRHQQAEEEYLEMRKNNRWKTMSENEVEIVEKSMAFFKELCPPLAYNEKVVEMVRVVLGYIEKIIQRRLPEFMYCLIVPIVYTLTDLIHNIPRMVGICIRIAEIQASIYYTENPEDSTFIFLKCLGTIDGAISEKIESVLDIRVKSNRDRLENFIKPFLSKMSSSYLSLDTTCIVYDELIVYNTVDKMFYLMALCMHILREPLLQCTHWDEFIQNFLSNAKKITPKQLESVLHMIPEEKEVEEKAVAPIDLRGDEYLDFLLDAYEEADEKHKENEELGQIYSTQRLLANNPFIGVQQQKALRGNLVSKLLESSKEVSFSNDTPLNKESKIHSRKQTLLHAKLQSIGPSIIRQLTKNLDLNESQNEQSQANPFEQSEMQNKYFRIPTKELADIREESFMNMSNLEPNRLSKPPTKSNFPGNESIISLHPEYNNSMLSDINLSEGKLRDIQRLDDNKLVGPVPELPEPRISKPERRPTVQKEKSLAGIEHLSSPDAQEIEKSRDYSRFGEDAHEISRNRPSDIKKPLESIEEEKSSLDLADISEKYAPGTKLSNSNPVNKSILGAGLLGIPDLSNLKPSPFDKFRD